MSYGRLDLFWPDGKFESYSLETPTVSIGRSNGCTIVLDTDTVSRYHLSLTHEKGLVFVSDMDSANGTYVDGVRLQGNEPHPLHGGEEMQVGHLRMIYHLLEDTSTVPIAPTDETQYFTPADDMGFHVEVHGPEIAIPPGSHASVEVTISNETSEMQRYVVEIEGLPEGWARINRPELVISEDNAAPVLINIKPIRHSDSKPGEYPIKISVYPKDTPEKRVEARLVIRILPFGGFGMALAARKINAPNKYRLHLHNQGSAPLPIYLIARSKDDALNIEIPQKQITLSAGERRVIQGEIKPNKRHWVGMAQEHPFDMMVRSHDDAAFLAAIRAYYVTPAVLPHWATLAMGMVAAVVGVLLLVGLWVVLQGSIPTPEITNLQANTSRVIRGESVEVEWEARNSSSFSVWVNGGLLQANLPPETTAYTLDTSPYMQEITVAVQAVNGDKQTEALLTLQVYTPLELERFEITPVQLYRNVIQEISIGWFVRGAALSRVEGLENFDPNFVIEPSRGEEANFNVTGAATEDFSLTLLAENQDGSETLEQTIELNLLNPECTTTTEDFTLYAAPDASSNVISAVGAGAVLVVDRQDETGAWLRTERPGGVFAWGARTALDCIGFNPASLRISVAAPPN